MKTYRVSQLAHLFGLSRSTLLYYDRIKILPPSGRTPSGYRAYTEQDRKRLERICHFRQTGLTLKEIQIMLDSTRKPRAVVLEKRLKTAGNQIRSPRNNGF